MIGCGWMEIFNVSIVELNSCLDNVDEDYAVFEQGFCNEIVLTILYVLIIEGYVVADNVSCRARIIANLLHTSKKEVETQNNLS